MKYKRFFEREFNEFIRDFSGLGNALILTAIFSLLLEGTSLMLAVLGLFITIILCYTLKLIFHKNRPNPIHHANFLEKIQSGSFPSLHSAVVIYSSLVVINNVDIVIAKVFFLMFIPIVGYSRYYLKKHFLKDIIGGYVIGFAVFIFLFLFYP